VSRADVLDTLARRVLAIDPGHPTRVGIDGLSAAGKTTLADELADTLRATCGRPVVRAGLDHFKRHVDLRTGYPPGSPESYYHEMYDTDAIRSVLLEPLGPGGSRRYRTGVMDLRGRTPVGAPELVAPDDAILVADGAFLQKPALFGMWDLRVYVDVDLADVQRRGAARDQAWMDSYEQAAERYRTYYVPGERLYLAEVGPATRADIVIDNRDFSAPSVTSP
jgi:uridine kinase